MDSDLNGLIPVPALLAASGVREPGLLTYKRGRDLSGPYRVLKNTFDHPPVPLPIEGGGRIHI